MIRSLLLVSAVSVLIAGCAQKSEEIAAMYVSPMQYEGYSCNQIRAEAARVSSRAALAMGVQDQQAQADAGATAISLILFWPAMFFIGGDGATASEVARLKGEMDALEQISIQKKCGIEFRS